MCPQGRGGSSPFFGTIIFVILYLQVGDINIDIKNNGVTDQWEIEKSVSPKEYALPKVSGSARSYCLPMAASGLTGW